MHFLYLFLLLLTSFYFFNLWLGVENPIKLRTSPCLRDFHLEYSFILFVVVLLFFAVTAVITTRTATASTGHTVFVIIVVIAINSNASTLIKLIRNNSRNK